MKRGNHNKIGRLYRCRVPGCDFVPQDKGHAGSLCVISYKCLSIYSYLKRPRGMVWGGSKGLLGKVIHASLSFLVSKVI